MQQLNNMDIAILVIVGISALIALGRGLVKEVLSIVGAIMALAGAAVFITGWTYAPYIYTVGAGFIALAQVNTPVKGKSKTLKRLRIQQIFGALALILTGAFMFTTRGNEWIACLTIAAILELYTAFRIPQEEEKEKAN